MKHSPIYLVVIIVIGLLAGCQMVDSGNSTGSINLSSFPLTSGSTWTYATNSQYTPPELDTVRVSILQTDTTSGKIQSLWELKYTHYTDSITVISSENTLRFNFPQGFPDSKSIVFPLEVGKKWSDDNSSHGVVSKDTVSWAGGTFDKSYQVVQKASIILKGDYGIRDTTNDTTKYWIEPGIGIVKIHQYEHYGSVNARAEATINTWWTLLSYKIH
ncbi:MAG TPA: hypothetical protein VKA08_15450 [Balneolales bacterium]|nr:hypothetical protein [Balneolales bacterium]